MGNYLAEVRHVKSEIVALLESHFSGHVCIKCDPVIYCIVYLFMGKKSNFDTIFTTLSSGVEDFGRRN